jgi:hypothetical protein
MGNNLLDDFQKSIADKGIVDPVMGHAPIYGIVAIIFFSIVGLGYFLYGKKSINYVYLICGIILMVFPYFISDTAYLIITGIVISVIPLIIKV